MSAKEYQGYLKPHLGLIHYLNERGVNHTAIASYLAGEGIKSPQGVAPSGALVGFALKQQVHSSVLQIIEKRQEIARLQAKIDKLEEEIDEIIYARSRHDECQS